MKKKNININSCSAFITKGTELIGTLKTDGDVFLDGRMDGEITAGGRTIVETESIVNADVFCKDLDVSGEVNGNLDVSNCIQVSSTGKIFGNIECDELLIDEGATYRGEISISNREK